MTITGWSKKKKGVITFSVMHHDPHVRQMESVISTLQRFKSGPEQRDTNDTTSVHVYPCAFAVGNVFNIFITCLIIHGYSQTTKHMLKQWNAVQYSKSIREVKSKAWEKKTTFHLHLKLLKVGVGQLALRRAFKGWDAIRFEPKTCSFFMGICQSGKSEKQISSLTYSCDNICKKTYCHHPKT